MAAGFALRGDEACRYRRPEEKSVSSREAAKRAKQGKPAKKKIPPKQKILNLSISLPLVRRTSRARKAPFRRRIWQGRTHLLGILNQSRARPSSGSGLLFCSGSWMDSQTS